MAFMVVAFMVVLHRCLRNMECTGKSPDPLNFFETSACVRAPSRSCGVQEVCRGLGSV